MCYAKRFRLKAKGQWLSAKGYVFLPPTRLQHICFRHGGHCQSFHGSDQVLADLKKNLRIVKVGSSADYGAGAFLCFGRLAEVDRVGHEDTRTYKNGFRAELAH